MACVLPLTGCIPAETGTTGSTQQSPDPTPVDTGISGSELAALLTRDVDPALFTVVTGDDLADATLGEEFLDADGVLFDELRLARGYAFYESVGWTPGETPQFRVYFEALRLPSTTKAAELVASWSGSTLDSEPYTGVDGEVTSYVPAPDRPRAEFDRGTQRGAMVAWPNGAFASGWIGYLAVGAHVFIAYGISTADTASTDAMHAFADTHLSPTIDAFIAAVS